MTALIAAFLKPILPWIIAAVTALGGLWGYGRIKRREGVKAERARDDAADAQAERETHERINQADTGAGLSDDARIERLRDFAAKHGARPPKAPRG